MNCFIALLFTLFIAPCFGLYAGAKIALPESDVKRMTPGDESSNYSSK